MAVGVAATTLLVGTGPMAGADPAPGFTFDAAKLEAAMHDCMAYAVGEGHLLMGWVKISTGETRQWRCSSLRHMMAVDDRDAHDPFEDLEAFMHCVDRVISYGFPRRATESGYTHYIIQYRGTARKGNVIVNADFHAAGSGQGYPRCPAWRG